MRFVLGGLLVALSVNAFAGTGPSNHENMPLERMKQRQEQTETVEVITQKRPVVKAERKGTVKTEKHVIVKKAPARIQKSEVRIHKEHKPRIIVRKKHHRERVIVEQPYYDAEFEDDAIVYYRPEPRRYYRVEPYETVRVVPRARVVPRHERPHVHVVPRHARPHVHVVPAAHVQVTI